MAVESKADLRERFRKQIDALIQTSAEVGGALQGIGQYSNHQIDKNEWEGNPTDLEGLSSAFSREENTNDVEEALADAENVGTYGDLAVSQLQGDYLACMERAIRSRNMNRVRRTMHAAARRLGHGNEAGVVRRGVQGYLETLLKFTKTV